MYAEKYMLIWKGGTGCPHYKSYNSGTLAHLSLIVATLNATIESQNG